MTPDFLARGLAVAAFPLTLAACGGGSGSGFDAGALGTGATGIQASAAQQAGGPAADASKGDEATSSSTRWAP